MKIKTYLRQHSKLKHFLRLYKLLLKTLLFSLKQSSPLSYITETIPNCSETSFKLCLEHINQQVFNKQYKDVKNLRQFSNNSIWKIRQELKIRQDRTQKKNNQAL